LKEQTRSRPGAARRKFKATKKARTTNWLRDWESRRDELVDALGGAHGCKIAGTRYAVARSKPLLVEHGQLYPRAWQSQPKKGDPR